MNQISAKYFSTQFINENKLKLTDIVILEYIYSWILSDNPPEFQTHEGKRAFYLSQSHIANDFELLITQPAISQKMKRFERCGIIHTTITDSIRGKFYVCFNWDKVIQSLASRDLLEKQKYKYCSNWFEKIFRYIDEEKRLEQEWKDEWNKKSWHEKIEENIKQEKKYKDEIIRDGLLDEYNKIWNKDSDNLLDISKSKYCKQADLIAKKILKKYNQYFVTRYPKDNEEPTKTYIKLCNKITDIYNGNFIKSRYYNFDENVFKNKQFETEGWKDKIKEVKGDWSKVRQLIFNAVENFILMFDENRMPLSKDYLTNNLNDWFFSDNPNSKGQSQFIQSLNAPMLTKQKLGLDKARNIVNELKEKSPVTYYAGHELNELLPINANEVLAWSLIKKIVSWGKLLSQYDENASYFLEREINGKLESGPKVLPALFADYLKEKNISVSLGTLDIEKAVDNNGPWCWFLQDACNDFSLNHNIIRCYDNDDFFDAYNRIGSDDEILVF